VIRSLLTLWVSGLLAIVAAVILVPTLAYLTYLLLSALISTKGITTVLMAIAAVSIWHHNRRRF
jgi:hypothetical protein